MKLWGRKNPPVTAVAANDAAPKALGIERALRRLEWTVIRRLDGLLQGDYRTLMRGTGLDLADLREYQHHDDVRHIDWNVTARLQVPHVRVFTEDREMSAWFVLDLSRSVDFGSGTRAKREVSAGFVGVLARLLTRHGNRVGAMFYGSRVERTIPARGGRVQVLRIINDLLKQPQLPKAPFTNLAPLINAGLHTIKRRSLIFIISDRKIMLSFLKACSRNTKSWR